jgi:ABC-type Fe3+ transport system permease subunit
MRKTEFMFGLCAGIAGLALAALSYFSLLPHPETVSYSDNTLKMYAALCMAANALGIAGALLVQKHNIPGAVFMAVSLIAILIFGFPWQSLSAVLYIISVVMATVPVKSGANIN